MESKLAFVFPGQGSQYVGMGYSLASRFPDFEPIFLETLREADAALGFPLSEIIKNGPQDRLKETEITQPALLTVSTAMARWLRSKGVHPSVSLGHSLGEYSALVLSEALPFLEAVKIVHLRGKLMQSAVPSGEGGMAALIGATPEIAEKICSAVVSELPGKVLEPSAYNCPGQIVLSGNIEAVDRSVGRAKEFGARMAMKLEVSGPFHCSLLNEAGTKLGEALEKIEITDPRVPVIANTTAAAQKTPKEIRRNLRDQVSKAVLWENSIRNVFQEGTRTFVEVGAGKVLAGLIKKIAPEADCISLDTIENLDVLQGK